MKLRCFRKLKCCIEEYTTRVGQQAVVLCCTPCKSTSMNSYKVFGSQPLESVVCKNKLDFCFSILVKCLLITVSNPTENAMAISIDLWETQL